MATNGLRQWDPMTTLAFNIVLEQAIRNSNVKSSGTIYRNSTQKLGFADDLDLVARDVGTVKENYERLKESSSELGLEANVLISESDAGSG